MLSTIVSPDAPICYCNRPSDVKVQTRDRYTIRKAEIDSESNKQLLRCWQSQVLRAG